MTMSSWPADTEAPKATRALVIALSCPPELDSEAEDTTHSEYSTQRSQAGSFLPASYIHVKRCFAGCRGAKVINTHTHL